MWNFLKELRQKKKLIIRLEIVIILLLSGWLIFILIGRQTADQTTICRIDKMTYESAKNKCDNGGGKSQFEYVSKWRRNGYALVITTNKTIADTETTGVNIKSVLGEIDLEVVSPTIIIAKIESKRQGLLKGKFEIKNIYYEKVNINLVKEETDKEWLNRWNSDEQQITGCVCPLGKTWDCDQGCIQINKATCENGGGNWQWWRKNCRCPEGKIWYSNWGRCEDIVY